MDFLKLLNDPCLYEQLLAADRASAEKFRGRPCEFCKEGTLHRSNFERKPLGHPSHVPLPEGFLIRDSFCCSKDSCRKRTTPPSMRFLGPKAYLSAIIIAVCAGLVPIRSVGVSRRTIGRWRSFWSDWLPSTKFWEEKKGKLTQTEGDKLTQEEEATPPLQLLISHCKGSAESVMISCLRFLLPITGGSVVREPHICPRSEPVA
jgi:hypothetical protein